jgi:hypothetical protein
MKTIEWAEQDNMELNALKKKVYHVDGKIDGLTEQEFNRFCDLNSKLESIKLKTRTAKSDIEQGQCDKKAGYYDKWYRYNRIDDGKAYDKGFNSVECEKIDGVSIVECMHN